LDDFNKILFKICSMVIIGTILTDDTVHVTIFGETIQLTDHGSCNVSHGAKASAGGAVVKVLAYVGSPTAQKSTSGAHLFDRFGTAEGCISIDFDLKYICLNITRSIIKILITLLDPLGRFGWLCGPGFLQREFLPRYWPRCAQ
jgi:hypothetical protein